MILVLCDPAATRLLYNTPNQMITAFTSHAYNYGNNSFTAAAIAKK